VLRRGMTVANGPAPPYVVGDEIHQPQSERTELNFGVSLSTLVDEILQAEE
jgi:hypothetical protein